MKKTLKNMGQFAIMAIVILAALFFFVLISFRSSEIIALLAETLTYILFEIILSKPGIGIIAFVLGAILVMAWGGRKQVQDETTIEFLSKELAETKKELELYKAREAALQNEQNELDKTREENGKAIIRAIS